MPEATTSGGAHSKQASSPGLSSWMWPETASSETPDSSHVCPSSLHAALMLIRACAWPVATSVGIGWPVRGWCGRSGAVCVLVGKGGSGSVPRLEVVYAAQHNVDPPAANAALLDHAHEVLKVVHRRLPSATGHW